MQLSAKQVCRTYALAACAAAIGTAILHGMLSGSALLGLPEPFGITAGILGAVVTAWLASGWFAPYLVSGSYLRAGMWGITLAALCLCVAAVAAGLVGLGWPVISSWAASTPVGAVGNAVKWVSVAAGPHAVLWGLVFGLCARWAWQHQEAA